MTIADAPEQMSVPHNPEVLLERLVEFVRLARKNGFNTGVLEVLDALKVAELFDITNLHHLRWGLRSLLCSNQNDWQRYDDLFDSYWASQSRKQMQTKSVAGAPVGKRDSLMKGADVIDGAATDIDQTKKDDESDASDDSSDGGTLEGASIAENKANSDFQFITDAKLMKEVDYLVERLAKKMKKRIIRRQKVKTKGKRVDLRKTVRNNLAYGGIPVNLAFKHNRTNQPRLLIIIDVSRSMSMYSYVFLRFARGIVNTFKDADAFAFHTRVVNITEALQDSNLTKVKSKLSLLSSGWAGGTKIGECFDSFLNTYKHRINSRTVVMVISDGLDTGEPQLLADKLSIIKGQCKKLIWLSPLVGKEGYEVKTGSMMAALPHIDHFLPAHNLESLSALEPELIRL